MKTCCKLLCISLALTTTAVGTPCFAYLGGFENVDGYEPFLDDVAKYNAGQYGPNAGGGTYINIPDNTGLWKKLQGPLYPTAGTTGNFAYATGHQNFDRTNPSTSDQALVITTNADGWTAGSQEYSYTVDSFDLAGFDPNSTGSETLGISFWSCSQIFGAGEGGGLPANTIGNTVSFLDTADNFGFGVGYVQPGTTTDYAAINVNGTWVQTPVTVNPHTYHRWDITLDLVADQVSIDIFEGTTLTTLASNVPLVNNMGDLDEMRFLSTPGTTNDKRWALDDFSFKVQGVPEPSSSVLAGMALLAATVLCFRRRNWRSHGGPTAAPLP